MSHRIQPKRFLASTLCAALLAAGAHAAPPQSAVKVLFDARTNPGYVEQVLSALPPAPEYYLLPSWAPTPSTPRTVSWSFVPDGLAINDFYGSGSSELFARMDTLFATQGGRATWIARVQATFDRWAELSGIDFVRLSEPGVDWDSGNWGLPANGTTRGAIRIAMKGVDGISGVLGYAFQPPGGDIVLDSAESWALSSQIHRYLRNGLGHSIGNAIGLDNMCSVDTTALMEPVLDTNFDGPKHDDIRGVHAHYGDAFEPSDSSANATNLGSPAPGTPILVGVPPPPLAGSDGALARILSISLDGEHDWFRFSVAQAGLVDVHVRPRGLTYSQAPITSSGGCGASSPANSLTAADLAFELIGSDGVTLLANAGSNGAGIAESLTDELLPAAGDYFIRVFENGAPSTTQLYELELLIDNCVDHDGDGFDDCFDNCPGLFNPSQADCDLDGAGDACEIVAGTQYDTNLDGTPDDCEACPAVITYCTAGTSTNGCMPSMSATGVPSAAASAGFTLTASGLEGQKSGLIFYGVSGPKAAPWSPTSSSFLCIKSPTQRTPSANSGGTADACDGVLSVDFLDYVATHAGALGSPLSAGDLVWTQAWYRDPPAPSTTNLSNGMQWTMCP